MKNYPLFSDLFFILGMVIVGIGVYLISVPFFFISVGIFCIILSVIVNDMGKHDGDN